jgi:predicted enzyme related to lactoylglutathione lyase
MKKEDYYFEGMTMAINNMDQMLAFYTHTFDIQFLEMEMYGGKLYTGKWGGLKLLFCPATIAQNTAKQNRHQLDIVVVDLDKKIEIAVKYGGKLMGQIAETETSRRVGVFDPDQNSIIFKELKNLTSKIQN